MNANKLLGPRARISVVPPKTERRASRSWRVLHTSESAFEIASLVESELSVGMAPEIATPAGVVNLATALMNIDASDSAQASLLNAWNNVRQWRKVILDASQASEFELVHAHSFASGMAGVRNCPVTVYSLEHFIEDFALNSSAAAEQGSWLARSFRVAEQFVLSRAAAVIVPTESIRQAVVHRGAGAEHVFVIPRALREEDFTVPVADEDWLNAHAVDRWHRVLVYAPDWLVRLGSDDQLTEDSKGLLEAFHMTATEEDGAYLLVSVDEAARAAVEAFCVENDLRRRMIFLDATDRERAFHAAHIIVAEGFASQSITPAASAVAFRALTQSKSLLAADLPCNRDVTPSGRGCLWYRSGDYKDLAHRLAFLARNRDFRTSLAESGQQYLLDTRSAESIAMEHDRVYRHAVARRKSGGLQTPAATLTPVSVSM